MSNQNQNQGARGEKWTWSEDRVFEHADTGVAAVVKRRDQGPPRYGIALVVNLANPPGDGGQSEPYFVPYLPGTRSELPWYSVDFGAVCGDLITAAQEYVIGEIERREKEDREAEAARQEKAQEKKKHYLANVEARRAANSAASAAAKGKARK